jgi:hypothetical protein
MIGGAMLITLDTEKDFDKLLEIVMNLPENKRNELLKRIKDDLNDSKMIEHTINESEISFNDYKRKRGIV